MEMRVRVCVLAVVLVVLGASSVFAQTNPGNNDSWLVGAPAGSTYAGAGDFNLAMNREGNRELGAPVTICSGTAVTGAAAGAGSASTTTFNVNDVFTIEYTLKGPSSTTATGGAIDPILATTGALGSANLFIIQNASGTGVTATATAAMFQPATVAGQTTAPPPQAIVTITITGAPTGATGINCISVQGLRFDLGNTIVSTTAGPQGVTDKDIIIATVKETSINGTAGTATPPLAIPNNDATALQGNAFGGVNGGMPSIATNAVGSTFQTLQISGGAVGLANSTGQVFGGFATGSSTTTKSGLPAAAPTLTANGRTATGSVAVQENPAASATVAVAGVLVNTVVAGAFVSTAPSITVNLPIADGGGMFRGFFATGPDATTWLNASGATTGTSITLTVAGMPTGSSVVFPATVSSASPGVVLNMSGGGTISAPGGTVTYATTINEGVSGSISTTATVGPSVEFPFTVTPGSGATGGAGATVSIQVTPAAGASAVPTYSPINTITVIPSAVIGTTPTTLFTIGPNQTTRTFPYVTFTGGTTSADYDTGLALTNAGRGVSVVAGASCFQVPAGGTIPTGCGGTTAGTVSTNGTQAGQDGPFTIFLVSSGTTVASIRSTASNFPNSSKLSSGNLVQGSTWVALLSQVTAAAGVTGAWSGELVIVTDFPQSNGFAFVSQFTNPGGGATMGYKVTNVGGEN